MQHLFSLYSLFALLALLGFALPAMLNACEKDEAVGAVFTAINASSGISIPGISYQSSREDYGNRPIHNTDHKARDSGISSTFIPKEVLP